MAVTVLVGLTIPLDAYAMARVMSRFQVGIAAVPNPFGGSWGASVRITSRADLRAGGGCCPHRCGELLRCGGWSSNAPVRGVAN